MSLHLCVSITMELKKFQTGNTCLNYIETGSGARLHFGHANGFGAGTYQYIFNLLGDRFHTFGLNACHLSRCRYDCGLNKPEIKNWFQLVDELIEFLEVVVREPVVGVGHSMGGALAAIASVKRPALFRKLILLDPVFLEPKTIALIKVATLAGQKHRFPLSAGARKRCNGWKSRDEAFAYFHDKKLFRGWSETMLRSYIDYDLADVPGGVELSCPPEIEAVLFESVPTDIWKWIKKIKTPTLIVRGEHSDVVTDKSWRLLKKIRPEAEFVEFKNVGHMFPMQKPEKTAEAIIDFAQK